MSPSTPATMRVSLLSPASDSTNEKSEKEGAEPTPIESVRLAVNGVGNYLGTLVIAVVNLVI